MTPQSALSQLLGLNAWGSGLAANMLMVSFGAKYEAIGRRGKKAIQSQYALHIQCPWRLLHGTKVIAGLEDYLNAEEESDIDQLFERIKAVFVKEPKVMAATALLAGAFAIKLQGKLRLEVFPTSSAVDEYTEAWRLLGSGAKKRHYVVRPQSSGYE